MNKQKILIVDDNPTGLHALLAILKHDYTIFVATSGESALQKAALEPKPDIILLDIIMPKMDGYEVCKRLKQNALTQHIPVIFISALDNEGDEEKGLNLGAIDYIHKPINSAIVKTRLKNHLDLVASHKKLYQQNIELIEAAKLREDVERIIRHDLKSPLNIIIGYPQLLKADDNLTNEQREGLDDIETAGYQMLDMINRSLDLYKMEQGCYQLYPIELDLIPVIKKVVIENKKLIAQKKIKIVLNDEALEGKSLVIKGELLLCYTLLENLLKNAVEASPNEKEIQIILSEDDYYCIIKIRNHGSVPEAIRERFFDKYVTHGKREGTGLGTYSAYLSVKTQKGSIHLDASEESMTSIIVKLPKD